MKPKTIWRFLFQTWRRRSSSSNAGDDDLDLEIEMEREEEMEVVVPLPTEEIMMMMSGGTGGGGGLTDVEDGSFSRRSSRDSEESCRCGGDPSSPTTLPSPHSSHLRVPFGAAGGGGGGYTRGRSASSASLYGASGSPGASASSGALDEDPRNILRRRSLPRMRSSESSEVRLKSLVSFPEHVNGILA